MEDLKAQCGRERDLERHDKHRVDALHPVQQAMVDCHGSQCGFCTPGFVMSLWSTYEHHQAAGTRPTRQQLADELSGNLCRCTGYRPILDAGQRMFDLPAARLDTAPVVQALAGLSATARFSYNAPLRRRTDAFHAPTTLAELAALRAAKPQAQLLAGSTDVGLWVNKHVPRPGRHHLCRRCGGNESSSKSAAMATRPSSTSAPAPRSRPPTAPLVQRVPSLTDVWLRFASPPIRNAGTMGGNVANGSPIGDSPPALMALDAEIELRQGERVRRMALPEFYVDYMKNRLEAGEFVQGLAVPLAAMRRQVRVYKISKRFDCDISALCAGFAIELDGDTVKTVRLAYGGMAAIVRRAARAEAALVGQPWSEASVRAAQAALAEDFKPLTDMRASAAYRLKVAQNLLQRLWLETRTRDPLALEATSVWSVMPHVLNPAVTEGV